MLTFYVLSVCVAVYPMGMAVRYHDQPRRVHNPSPPTPKPVDSDTKSSCDGPWLAQARNSAGTSDPVPACSDARAKAPIMTRAAAVPRLPGSSATHARSGRRSRSTGDGTDAQDHWGPRVGATGLRDVTELTDTGKHGVMVNGEW